MPRGLCCHENKYRLKLSLLCHTTVQKPTQELDIPTIVFLLSPSLWWNGVPDPLCFWLEVWVFIYILNASPADCGSVLLLQQKCTYLLTLLMAFLRSSSSYGFTWVVALWGSWLAVLGHHPHTPPTESHHPGWISGSDKPGRIVWKPIPLDEEERLKHHRTSQR